MVLANVLGLDYLSSSGEKSRPRDDEDFYILGGNSLSRKQIQKGEAVLVREWNFKHPDASNKGAHSFDEIVELLVEAFSRNDIVARAFELSLADLKLAASIYLGSICQGQGIVLTASFVIDSPEDCATDVCWDQEQLVGTLISLPMQSVPELPKDHKLHALQRYFEFCSAVHLNELNPSKTLTVIMAGMVPPVTDFPKCEARSTWAKWKRITLEILAKMETELLKVAQEQNYTHVETLNTCETTKELCLELGYTLFKTTRMQQFAEAEHLALDPKYYDHCCYHMIKAL
ncbi:unnamed protein product [Echinostoma caproni]|uniref:Nucleotidyltransferase n=1 Tax=Echinostoma caproni TaxID=27848 RepID=A0A183APX6_9TREM|nr:unnamed protein product [Echinostoma caproni]